MKIRKMTNLIKNQNRKMIRKKISLNNQMRTNKSKINQISLNNLKKITKKKKRKSMKIVKVRWMK